MDRGRMSAERPQTSSNTTPKNIALHLHIQSFSPDVPDKITFPTVSLSTTVGELKKKIQDNLSMKPAPERQRVIYRGFHKPDGMLLQDMFSHEEIENAEAVTLHVVITPAATSAESSSANSNRPTRLSRLPDSNRPQRPASTGQLPEGLGMRPFHLPGMNHEGLGVLPQPSQLPFPMPPGQLPLPLPAQDMLNANLALLGHQINGSFGGQFGMGLPIPNLGVPQQGGLAGPRPQMQGFGSPASFQQLLAQQQQARAAAGQHGVGSQDGNQGLPSNLEATAREPERAGNNAIPQMSAGVSHTNTTVHEGQGPNGSQWRVVINQSLAPPSFVNNLGNFGPPVTGPQNTQPAQHSQQVNPTADNPVLARSFRPSIETTFPRNLIGASPANGASGSFNLSAHVDERLTAVENTLITGGVPSELDMWLLQYNIHELTRQQPWLLGRPDWPILLRYLSAASRASAAHRSVGIQTIQPGTRITSLPTHVERLNSLPHSTTAYVLSSPSGPHALLLSPFGIYTTSGFNIPSPFYVGQPVFHPPQQIPAQSPAVNIVDAGNGPPNPPQDGQAVQQQQPPPPNEARDVFRIIFPLGGHLWLLVRLFGFVYFFTAGWRRVILLVLCAMTVFIAQTGVFQPLQQAVWDPIRRHVEGLVPLGAGDRPAGANHNVPENQRQPNDQPNPRDMADRLLRERNNQQGDSIIRRNLHRAERATALFIASLVPGVSERHIAARNEERRVEEEQTRRIAAAAEQDSIQRAENAQATDETQDVFTDAQESAGANHNPSRSQGQEQEPQHQGQNQNEQPVVEI